MRDMLARMTKTGDLEEALSFAEIGRRAAKEAQRAALLEALKQEDWNLTAVAKRLSMGAASNVIRAIRDLDLREVYDNARISKIRGESEKS
jgi:transcriptional regulator with GAF, ATPase, and Fis domain